MTSAYHLHSASSNNVLQKWGRTTGANVRLAATCSYCGGCHQLLRGALQGRILEGFLRIKRCWESFLFHFSVFLWVFMVCVEICNGRPIENDIEKSGCINTIVREMERF